MVLALHAVASGAESDRLSASRAAAPAAQDDSPQAEDDTLAATNCRYGVGYVPSLPASLSWIPTLDAGWYVNFSASTYGVNVRSATFAPVIRVRQEILAGGVRTDNYTVFPPLTYSCLLYTSRCV